MNIFLELACRCTETRQGSSELLSPFPLSLLAETPMCLLPLPSVVWLNHMWLGFSVSAASLMDVPSHRPTGGRVPGDFFFPQGLPLYAGFSSAQVH